MSTVSVITVCFNEREDIGSTLESILRQCGVNVELIVVDGASTDGTVEVLENYRKDVREIISEPDKGIFDAMNKGLRVARGDWVVFMNAGDEFVGESAIKQLLSDVPDEAKVVYGNRLVKQGRRVRPYPQRAIEYGVIPFCHQAALFRRAIGDEFLQFDPRYFIYGDFEVVARIYSSFPNAFLHVDCDVAVTRPGGVSSYVSKRKRYEKYLALFEHFGLIGVARGAWGRLRSYYPSVSG